MKIAIHHRAGSFSERWISYCKEKNIDFKIVNCYNNDIVKQVEDCDVVMWHHNHHSTEDLLFAKQLLFSFEHAGKIVFPDFKTGWHFDDKVGQKYLFECIGAPLVPTYVFYSKNEAINWANSTSFPKVFKLRGGSGSSNVRLVNNRREAISIVKRAFNRGINQYSWNNYASEKLRHFRSKNGDLKDLLKIIYRLFSKPKFYWNQKKEAQYVYFQDYIENDGYDVRVVVINKKAVALKRLVRDNDFRASGSGNLVFENEYIDKRFIQQSFEIVRKLKTHSLALDFIKDNEGDIYVVEMSYAFPMLNFLDGAAGFWTEDLNWVKGNFNLQAWIIEGLLSHLDI